jgi:dinuclear metal center YbgI/SA1388 family protein
MLQACMHDLSDLVHHLNALLRISELPDYPQALNGLQLESHSGRVSRVAAAVDASAPIIAEAIAQGADLLLVHHGLFWSGLQPCTGPVFKRLQPAMAAGLAVYSAHLPLDVHPELGNNAQLAAALGLQVSGSFLPYKGLPIGLICDADLSLTELEARLDKALQGARVHPCRGGAGHCRRVGICSGGSGSEVAAAAAAGVDCFITGEGPHWSYTLAEELGLNVLYGGHYATETFGVKALAASLTQSHQLPWSFIDRPSGL